MPAVAMSDPAYRRDLGRGLLLRWSSADDAERLIHFAGAAFRTEPAGPPNSRVAAYTREVLSGHHPLIGRTDFALVEDTRAGTIIATTSLSSQQWEYGGIAFAVGRPNHVATEPAHRNRGLIRAIFELIHARSAALGHLAQGITGIPYFYRQFGYEYALDLRDQRSLYFGAVPHLPPADAEPFRLRDAAPADVPLLQDLYDRERSTVLVSTRIDTRYWHWVVAGLSADSAEAWRTQLIVGGRGQGRPVGYVLSSRRRWGRAIGVWGLSLAPGVSLIAVLPSVLRALQGQASTLPAGPVDPPPCAIAFGLGRAHPVYDALGDRLVHGPPDAAWTSWYVRVADVPAFIRHSAPVLERRLAASALAGHSGEVTLDFYRDGLRLAFTAGRLAGAAAWRRPAWGQARAGFPPLVFLQLLFGHRSLDELRYSFPDVWADDVARPLLQALFPSGPARVLPLD